MEETFAACYIRVSTEEQTEYSPEAQRRALERYAGQHKLSIRPEHVYVDAGISGRRAETRPAFMAMIAAAKEKPPPFSVILVHKFDRFARSREDSIVYKSMLRRQCGVQVVSITEHLEDDRMGLILEAMLEAMAEYYSVNLADEVRKGMTEKARRGELQTSPPFGYRVEHNALVPVEEEAQIVREIFRRFLAGASIASIARWTQRLGARTHRGNPLDPRRVRYILENPAYIGQLRWQPGKGQENRPPPIMAGSHPPLVDPKDFEAAAARLKDNAARFGQHARPAGDRKHWLAGLVRCAHCGGGLIFSQPHYLKCGRYAKGKCPVSQHVPVRDLEEAILTRMQGDAACRTPFLVQTALQNEDDTQAALTQELSGLERKLQRLREAYLCGADSLQEYKTKKQVLSAQADHLRQDLEHRRGNRETGVQDRLFQALVTLKDPAAGTEEKYRAAAQVLETCVWDKEAGRVTLVYRLDLGQRPV